MMNTRGFTLLETLASLIIIGLVAIAAVDLLIDDQPDDASRVDAPSPPGQVPGLHGTWIIADGLITWSPPCREE